MLQLRLTGKLQKELGIQPSLLSGITQGDTSLGNWTANIFMLDRRKAIIFMNDETLFSFVFYGIKKSDVLKMHEMFLGGLEHALLLEEIPQELILKIISEYSQFEFTKTASATTIAYLSDLTGRYKDFTISHGGLKVCDFNKLIKRVNRTPQKKIGWDDSFNAVRQAIGLERIPYNSSILDELS